VSEDKSYICTLSTTKAYMYIYRNKINVTTKV